MQYHRCTLPNIIDWERKKRDEREEGEEKEGGKGRKGNLEGKKMIISVTQKIIKV